MITLSPTHTLHQLNKIKVTRPPGAGEDWQGVKHADLIHSIIHALVPAGYSVDLHDPHEVVLGRNGADMLASIRVGGMGGRWDCLGIAASNARRKSLHLYVGGYRNTVPLCIRRFGGQVRFPSWTYDKNFRLTDVAEEMVTIWEKEIEQLDVISEELNQKQISIGRLGAVLCHAAQRNVIGWRSVSKIWNEWRSVESHTGLTAIAVIAPHLTGRLEDHLDNHVRLCRMIRGKEKVPA